MKKFFSSISFIFKILLLVVVLIGGWAYLNVTNLIKGKKTADKAGDLHDLFGINTANADDPSCFFSSCPHVAVFDGARFTIENDFLCGSPAYFSTDHLLAPEIRRQPVRSDMLKFSKELKRLNGAITVQLQENEKEESYIDWVKLLRVVHPEGTEVIVSSDFENFHVFSRNDVEKNMHVPERAVLSNGTDITPALGDISALWTDMSAKEGAIVPKGETYEMKYSGLEHGKATHLVIKASFRDWMMGMEPGAELKKVFAMPTWSTMARQAAFAAVVAGYFILEKKSLGGLAAFAPFVLSAGSQSKSIVFSYENEAGVFSRVAVTKPRAWAYGTEVVDLPADAVHADGTMSLKAEFTKRHKLAVVGVLQNMTESKSRTEVLAISKAESTRTGNVTEALSGKKTGYTHMIPGEAITVTYNEPALVREENEKETYLLQSMGFYGPLSKSSALLAGNWQERIAPEAREYMESLTSLQSYK